MPYLCLPAMYGAGHLVAATSGQWPNHGRRRTVLGHQRLPIKGDKNGDFLFRNLISVNSAVKAFSANQIARIRLFTKIFGAQHWSGKYPFLMAFCQAFRRR